jgi:hypothetical protein
VIGYEERGVIKTGDEDEGDADESPATDNTDGRLDRALGFARSQRRRSEDLPPLDIQNAIVQILQKSPNHTCTLKSLTSRVLKQLGVLTRGNPRLAFEKRVMRNLGALKRKEFVEEYKAKNKRVRLVVSQGESLFQEFFPVSRTVRPFNIPRKTNGRTDI